LRSSRRDGIVQGHEHTFTRLSCHDWRCTPSKEVAARPHGPAASTLEAMNGAPPNSAAGTSVPRLLDAVELLCAEMSPSDVTMRMIAAEAGLSLGLAYRYFESKDELFGAALDRMAERIAAAAAGDDPIAVVSALWKAVADSPAFPRLVTSMILSGQNVSEVMSRHPLMRDIARSAAELGMDDPQTIAGVTGLVTIAGAMYGSFLNGAIGRDPDDPRLHDAAGAMMALWVEDGSTRAPRK
jgi:AcrR family transcriptional regulator